MVKRVTPAVRRDLKAIAERDPELAKCGLAQTALVLAAELDEVRTSGTAAAALLAITTADDFDRCKEIAERALEQIGRESQVSASEKASVARALLATMDRLRELVPPELEGDRLDELGARRADRLAAG